MKKKFSVEHIEKMLKHHLPLCKMHEWSLGKDMYCSCGRDSALGELEVLVAYIRALEAQLEKGYTL